MVLYFMRTYYIREKYEKNPHNFKSNTTNTKTTTTSISTKYSIEYYKKNTFKKLLSYTKGYRTQQYISKNTKNSTISLYGKGSKNIKEDKLSQSSISNLQKNIIKKRTKSATKKPLNDNEKIYRKYNMQQQQHQQQHQQHNNQTTRRRKTYSNKIGAENSIERKFEIFYNLNSKIDITNLLQLLSTKQFILSENKIKNSNLNFIKISNIKPEILTKNLIIHKINNIRKLINLWNIIYCRIVIIVNIEEFKSTKIIIIMLPKLINLTEIVVVGIDTNPTITEISNNEIGIVNDTMMTTKTSTISTIMENNLSNMEILRNNIMKNDYFEISDEVNDTFTPAMSQVILAPTVNTAIHFQTQSTIAAVVSGSTSNSFQINVNSTDDEINSFYFYETEQFALLWVLFTVIVLGNSAVLITLFMNKNRKSRMNFFIKQLALADICVGLLNVLTDIIWRITVSWRAGNLACKLIRFSQVCVTYASTYVLVALSIDRYDAITHPMNFSGSWQRARRLVISAWTVSAIFSAPMLILYEEKLIQGQTQCWIELGASWRWQLYMSLVAVTLFAFPALIISACYAIIVRTIWVKGSVFVPSERTGRNSACLASRRASSRGIIPRAKVKTVKMTFVIVIVFVVCWSPYIIYDLLQVFNQIPRTQTNIAIATFMQSLAPLNSAANPLIYCLFSTQVCRALKRIPPFRWILCSCCCQTQGHNSAPIRCTTVGQRLHNSCDSMRTLTTSLNVSRRSNNCMRPARVVIVERPKTILAMSEV